MAVRGARNPSLELQHSYESTEFLEFCEKLIAPGGRRQLASSGLERHFALAKGNQPLDGSVLDDRHPDSCAEREEWIERRRPMLGQVKRWDCTSANLFASAGFG